MFYIGCSKVLKVKGEEMMDLASLAARAAAVRHNAYAPYSGFAVGAALLCADGEIFTGVNVENSSYGLTVCAERNALFAAVGAMVLTVGTRGATGTLGADTAAFGTRGALAAPATGTFFVTAASTALVTFFPLFCA